MPEPLVDLADGLDTDKESKHGYLSGMYQNVLAPYRELVGSKILEIGVWRGGSHRLWRRAFMRAEVWGVDIAELPDMPFVKGRSKLIKADAYDPAFVQRLPCFSVIIDDGPHTLESQIAFVKLYAGRLAPGGVMVIEDIASDENLAAILLSFDHRMFTSVGTFDARRTHAEDSLALVLQG